MWIFDQPAPHERFVTIEQGGTSVVKLQPMRIIAAIIGVKTGIVVTSTWLPKDGRWEFMIKGEEPLAWMPYPEFPAAEIAEKATPSPHPIENHVSNG
ncbi:hypothetical protein [Pleomorphomonas sp. PLEO]|uniref:hypothetical protein n=1 Tax=Pleomorphomonas sp. PLEO TaxID=3239306 RepID=UPI00351F1948